MSIYDKCRVGYFPPYKKYYIGNGENNYLSPSGGIGRVYYYLTREEAEKVLKKFSSEEDVIKEDVIDDRFEVLDL